MNVAVALGRLGHESHLLTSIGDDDRGRVIRDHLATSHVVLTPGSTRAPSTSTALAKLDHRGAATYTFDLAWNPTLEALPENLDAVHSGSIAAVMTPGATAVAEFLDRAAESALISYDPNVRPALMGDPARARESIEAMISRADVVKASDEDIAWLYDLDPADGDALEETVDSWRGLGPNLTVMTRGGEGAVAFHRTGRHTATPVRVDVADTVGAGDTFSAGLIDGLLLHGVAGQSARTRLQGLDSSTLGRILDHAARLAAVTVSRAGANPPWASEIR